MNQSIEDAIRREFEAKFDCTGLVYEKHSLSENMVYSPANAQISQSWTLANLRNNQWTAWQAARAISQSEPVAEVVEDKLADWSKPHATVKWLQTDFPIGTKFYAAPQQAMPSEQNMKRAIYENLMIAISHAKVAEDSFSFLSNQIEAMFNTEFSIRKRESSPTAPIERDK
jgi:hypothetical protein